MLRALLHRLPVAVFIALVAAWAFGSAAAQAQDVYLSAIPDLPLMPGLQEVPGSGMVFDKPAGRIVDAFAEGAIPPQAVVAFYDETLPQLGWRRAAAGTYLREGERLSLDLVTQSGQVSVQFRLYPQ